MPNRLHTLVAAIAGLFVFALCCPPAICQGSGLKLVSSGEFTDKHGSIHSWKINGAHTLVWDGQPYLPVGGVFYSKYISVGQTEENWNADVQALELIKSKGITDLLLKSVGPITWTKPEAWQRLLDHLDLAGFTYGIDFSDGPKPPLSGFIVEPTRYRVPDIINDTTLTYDMPDVNSAFWMLCSAGNGSVIASGGAAVSDGKVTITLKGRAGQNCILLLYPCRELSGNGTPGTADLWSGFDEYRDRLLSFVSGIKFGRGVRFFVDPLVSKMDFAGELDSVVPDSSDFRLEFEAYLAKKYLNIGSLNAAWGLVDDNLKSFQEAARLVPLWRGARGIPAAYDRARGQRFTVDAPRSKIWDDIQGFRNTSAQSYLNTAADLLKRNAANVPVVYRAERFHRVYVNPASRGGFDGLGVDAYGHGEVLVTGSAGAAYSLSEEAARSTWFIVTGTQDTPKRGKSTPGYASASGMLADLDTLREVGAKGIFVNGLQVLPEEGWRNHSLVLVPEQLDWLKQFKDRFASQERADFVPTVVYYPVEPVVGAAVTRLGPDSWWLPSMRKGTTLAFGDDLAGYTLAGQDGMCIWSRAGDAVATFVLDQSEQPVVMHPANSDGILLVEKKKAQLKLNGTPVLVKGLDVSRAFPTEVVEGAVARLTQLVAREKAAGRQVAVGEESLKHAKEVLKHGTARVAYDIAHSTAEKILTDAGTYAWIEGESTVSHSFDGVTPAIGASAGAYLNLQSSHPAVMSPYGAAYPFLATREGLHELWIAMTTADGGASQFSYSVDGATWQPAALSGTGATYARSFAWFKVGSVNLTKGHHMLQVRVDSPNAAGAYQLGIDAIVVSPSEFTPNGIDKP